MVSQRCPSLSVVNHLKIVIGLNLDEALNKNRDTLVGAPFNNLKEAIIIEL